MYKKDDGLVTCGSAIKIESADVGYYLNSEEKNLGTGSGQQIVTFVNDASTGNTLWWVRPAHTGSDMEYSPDASCKLAEPIKCGSMIRLTHIDTMRNLHSHEVKSPLSQQQEVSAYGQGDGKGDAGDDWIVECKGKYWTRETVFRLVSACVGFFVMTQFIECFHRNAIRKTTEFPLKNMACTYS